MSPKHSVTFVASNPRSQSVEAHENNVQTPKKSRSGSQMINYFRPAHSEIRFGRMRFLITDRPSDAHIESYITDLERYGVNVLVRVCESTYNVEQIKNKGVRVEDWEFVDGQPPPESVISKWLDLCWNTFHDNYNGEECIAVHCVAGLGRAPVLVGLALMEAGMKCDDAVFLIRSQRRGALNEKQLAFLQQYRSQGRLRKLRYASATKQHKSCCIM